MGLSLCLIALSPVGRKIIIRTLEKQLSQTLRQTVVIKDLKTNLWSWIKVENISISNGQTTKDQFLQIKKLEGRFNLRPLLKKRLTIQSIDVQGLSVSIQRDSTGRFQLPQLPALPGEEPSKTKKGLSLEIALVKLSDGQANYDDKTIPLEVELKQISLNLSSAGKVDSYQGSLQTGAGYVRTSGFSGYLDSLKCELGFVEQKLVVHSLFLNSGRSWLTAEGKLDFARQTFEGITLDGQVQLDEISHFLQKGSFVPDSFSFSGKLQLSASIQGTFQNPRLDLRLDMPVGRWAALPIEELNLVANYQKGQINISQISFNLFQGRLLGRSFLYHRDSKIPGYRMEFQAQQLALSQLLHRLYGHASDLTGNLNGKLLWTGQGTNVHRQTVSAELTIQKPTLRGKPIDDFFATITFNHGHLALYFSQGQSQVYFQGQLFQERKIQAAFQGQIAQMAPWASLFDLQELSGQLEFKGEIQGDLENPQIKASLQFTAGSFRGFLIDTVTGALLVSNKNVSARQITFQGNIPEAFPIAQIFNLTDSLKGTIRYRGNLTGDLRHPQAEVQFLWQQGVYRQFRWDSLRAHIQLDDQQILCREISLIRDSLALKLEGQLALRKGYAGNLKVNLYTRNHQPPVEKLVLQNSGTVYLSGGMTKAKTPMKSEQDSISVAISGEGIDLHPVASLTNVRIPLSGRLNFDFLLQGVRKKPRMSLAVHIAQPQVESMKLDSIAGQFSYNNQLLSLEKLQIYHGGNSSRLRGKLPLNLALVPLKYRLVDAPLELESVVNNLDLSLFQPFLPDSMILGGRTSQHLTFSGSWDTPTVAGILWLQDVCFHFANGKSPIDSVNAELVFYQDEAIKDDPWVEIKRFRGNLLGTPFTITGHSWFRAAGIKGVEIGGQLRANLGQLGQLSLEGQKSMDGSIRLHATGRSVNLGYLTQLFKPQAQVEGQTSFELNLSGTRQKPFIELICQARKLRWQDLVVDSLKGTVSYQNEMLQLNQARLVAGSGNLLFHGHLPYVISLEPDKKPPMSNASGPLMLKSYCENLDVGLLKPLVPALDNLGGKLAYQLQFTGNLEAPLVTGSLQLDQAFLTSKKIPAELDNIGMRLHFVQGKAIIDSCYGQLGRGSFSVTGFLEYQNRSLTQVHLISKLSNLKITQPRLFTLAINQGTIEMKHLEDYLQISGRLFLDETKYTKDFAPQVLLPFARKLGRPLSEPASWMKKTKVDVIFQTGDNLWVDNNIAKIKMNANLSLIGTLEQPNLTGRVVALEGYVLYLDRKFKLTRGILDFTDPNKINPQIDLAAESQLKSYHTLEGKEYTITLTLTGTLENPILTLTSEPFLEKADIVALLTVGRTRQGLLTQVNGSRGSTFKDVLLERAKEITSQRVVGMAEKTVGDFLDLKSITIEGNLFKADRSWGPRVTATKQITERLDLTYSTVVGHVNEQRIKLNYKLFKQFSIEGETDQQGKSGLDFKYQYKFW